MPNINPFSHPLFRPRLAIGLTAALVMLTGVPAHADSHRLMPRAVPSAYVQECAACHIAYPPALLPAASWQRVMTGLDKHYGTDASLDATTVAQLSAWLKTEAGTGKRAAEVPPQDRITRTAWFEHKHRKIDAPVWKLVSVKSAANCAACHSRADQGDFDERSLRVPAGVDARSRRAWND